VLALVWLASRVKTTPGSLPDSEIQKSDRI
jgi:hypothetical protein